MSIVLEALCYTPGMKTAVSIPDDIFKEADELARRARRTRSDVYAAALREYLARHDPDSITRRINAVVDQVGDGYDEWNAEGARQILESTEW